ncbi:MAG TPA: MBL fold metallo-hydrolase [Bryobacteraceae bacterium]|nr:MBL fold metallo-hydrolase [Bryobacteraceae bacterium]
MFCRTLAIVSLFTSAVTAASPNLDIYWIDAEGGASTLVVTPGGRSMLIDTANRTSDDRDAKRIFAAAQQAGLTKIDVVLTTHYHGDHVGAMEALQKLIPIGQYIDHGESIEFDRPRGIELYKNYVALTQEKRRSVKPGDSIPLKGVNITVVAAGGKVLSEPLKGGGASPADVCKDVQQKAPETDIENNESVGIMLTFGKFKFLALGDLPWNYEKALVCPRNLIGMVDVYQTTHHGLDRSGLPQLVWSVKPRVAVMNNGPRKGGPQSTFEILRKSPGLEDIWQGHLALGTPKEINTNEQMIANFEPTAECKGHLLKVSVAPDGKYTVTNSRNGFSKTYASR